MGNIQNRLTDSEFLLAQIFNLVSPQERLGGTNPIECDKILALTLRYLATGESFQYLSRILLNSVSYIIKGCCKAIVERMASAFVKVPSTKADWVDISRKFKEVPHPLGAIDGKHICFRYMVAPFICGITGRNHRWIKS